MILKMQDYPTDQDLKTYIPANVAEGQDAELKKVLLWDRKTEGGFPGKSRC
jgi:predicted Rdx family selenoprotein